MFVQSNDPFLAPQDGGIPLFDADGRAMHGKLTRRVALYDAGTEKYKAPGAGAELAPRQSNPILARLGEWYPAVDGVIYVQLEPVG